MDHSKTSDHNDDESFSLLSSTWILFFGCVIFSLAAMTSNQIVSWFFGLVGRVYSVVPEQSKESLKSLSDFLRNWTVIGLLWGYVYVCENHPPFPHNSFTLSNDPDPIAMWMALLLGFAIYHRAGDNSVRDGRSYYYSYYYPQQNVLPWFPEERIWQEFKGWTFLLFVLHRCYRHDISGSMPNQLFLAVYTWWTSFYHAMYFYTTHDYSLIRIFHSLWRPGSLILLFQTISLPKGHSIIHFLSFMEIFAFTLTYLLLFIKQSVNRTRWGLRIKLIVAAIFVYLVWDVPNSHLFLWIFGVIFHGQRSSMGLITDANGALWEWYVLSTQFHWYVLFGIAFAINQPISSLWRDKLDQQIKFASLRMRSTILALAARVLVGVALVGTTVLVWICIQHSSARSADFFRPAMMYFYLLPILGFLYFRTCSRWLRQNFLPLFEIVGLFSLEGYVLHHHILLSSNGRSILTLLSPGWRKLGFTLTFALFLLLSYGLYAANYSISSMLFSDPKTCSRKFAILATFWVGCAVLCSFLHWINLMQGWSIVFLIVVFGGIAFSSILREAREPVNTTTWVPFAMGAVCVCTLAILLFVISGPHSTSASEISCQEIINGGTWFPGSLCDETAESYAYREFGVSSTGTCASTYLAWGWKSSGSSSCPTFSREADTLLRQTLTHRKLMFVGDSMVRHLYHATCRQLGHHDAGAYNTSLEKWSNYSRHYKPNTTLDFRWAPYTDQIIPLLQHLQKIPNHERPDTLIAGGGPWDLLHNTRTEANTTTLTLNIKQLASELRELGGLGQKIIWVIPTKINTWSLPTADKQKYMREDQMAELRQLYFQSGVPGAASFVLDGVAFSHERVNECYDGVHYPFSVYDGGSQILLNAIDWLMPPERDNGTPLEYGGLAQPIHGLVALILFLVCVISMDSFCGFSYLAEFFVPFASPIYLYEESIGLLSKQGNERHRSAKLLVGEERDLSELDEFLGIEENDDFQETETI